MHTSLIPDHSAGNTPDGSLAALPRSAPAPAAVSAFSDVPPPVPGLPADISFLKEIPRRNP